MTGHEPRRFRFAFDTVASIALVVVFIALRLISFLTSPGIKVLPDSSVFIDMASQPLFGSGLWAGLRPPVVPLIYKILGNHSGLVVLFQWLLSVICWSLLALSLTRVIKLKWLKIVACGVVLLFSMSTEIIVWEKIIQSESITLSLLALFVASWLWLLQSWQWTKALVTMAVAALWVFTRESNAWIVLCLAVILIITGVVWRSQRRGLVMAAVFIGLFLINDISSNAGQRWIFPFLNVLAKRVLPDPAYLAYFEQRGMPVSPALMRRSTRWASSDDWAFYHDPDLEEFREWMHRSGKSTYVRFLLTDPSRTLQDPLRNLETLIYIDTGYFAPLDFIPILPKSVNDIVFFRRFVLVFAWSVAVSFGIALALAVRQRRLIWIVPLLLIFLAYPHGIIVWHGDAMEVERHALQLSVHLRLGFWMLLLFAADLGFAYLKERRRDLALRRGGQASATA
ncbi:hypothetical protein ACFLU6_05145 [Acidobacteriota bacterium]